MRCACCALCGVQAAERCKIIFFLFFSFFLFCVVIDTASMAKNVLVAVADGSEDMEATITVDVLRRAGAQVVVASVGSKEVLCRAV